MGNQPLEWNCHLRWFGLLVGFGVSVLLPRETRATQAKKKKTCLRDITNPYVMILGESCLHPVRDDGRQSNSGNQCYVPVIDIARHFVNRNPCLVATLAHRQVGREAQSRGMRSADGGIYDRHFHEFRLVNCACVRSPGWRFGSARMSRTLEFLSRAVCCFLTGSHSFFIWHGV